ncbi:MAG: cellulose biosynthesis protein BcsN [Actinomycetospora chiangmaiensis]|nr:cellulose biosynthesis protein BcsN [Actinomycetospora chiangmaiensis]
MTGPASSASLALPSGQALAALPPAAGAVLSVMESRRSNAVIQTIVLAGDHAGYGENKITITALTGTNNVGNAAGDPVKIAPPTDAVIEDELAQAFPTTPMRIANVYDRNAQGPFGYATGRRADGTGCLYAWQYVGPSGNLNLFDTIDGRGPQAMSVRVRLCKANATEAELAGYMQQMVVSPPGPSSSYAAAAPAMMAPGGDALAASGVAPQGFAAAPLAAAPMMAAPMMAAPPMMAPPMMATAPMGPSRMEAPAPRRVRHTRHVVVRYVMVRPHAHRMRPRREEPAVSEAAPPSGSNVPFPGGSGGSAPTPMLSPPLPARTAARPAPADTGLPLPN